MAWLSAAVIALVLLAGCRPAEPAPEISPTLTATPAPTSTPDLARETPTVSDFAPEQLLPGMPPHLEIRADVPTLLTAPVNAPSPITHPVLLGRTGLMAFVHAGGAVIVLDVALTIPIPDMTVYTSHVIGTRNLDMAVAGDFDGDGRLELLLPNQARTELGAIRRTMAGAEVAWTAAVEGVVSTNLAAVSLADDGLAAGVGREDCEARAIAHVDHPRIVTIHNVDEVEERLFIVMHLVDGPSLAELIARRGRLPWPEAMEIITAVAEGLDYAHAQGILHRDLKPANILLDPKRGPLLSDFGFAKLAGDNSLSQSGDIVGTPHWRGTGAA